MRRAIRGVFNQWALIQRCQIHTSNVKRWRSGSIALPWCVAAIIEAERKVRHVQGHRENAQFVAALGVEVKKSITGALGHFQFNGSRDIPEHTRQFDEETGHRDDHLSAGHGEEKK